MDYKLTLVLVLAFSSLTCSTEIETTSPFVAQLYVSNINSPRGLLLDNYGDILVVGRGDSKIFAIRETNQGNGHSTVETTTIIDGTDLGLNHGIAFYGGFLYASSDSTVYRWPYVPGQFSLVDAATVETVITDITPAGHSTRTLIFDNAGLLYVSIGSANNIDPDSSRARIYRFNLTTQSIPIRFGVGEVFADGVRNTVGLAFNSNGILFGVDNGPDMLNHPDLGGEIWPENPGEEMNKFIYPSGTHYGYPYCWSTYILSPYTAGTQFAWPSFRDDGVHSDDWCQNTINNAPPIMSMPAHSAPLSIEFYNGDNCDVDGGFPCNSIGDAFVAFRGAWHEGVSYGYRVSQYKFNIDQELPTGEIIDVLIAPDATNSCNTCLRPVNAVFNKAGHLIVTADATNEIYRVAYNTTLPEINGDGHTGGSKRIFSAELFLFIIGLVTLVRMA